SILSCVAEIIPLWSSEVRCRTAPSWGMCRACCPDLDLASLSPRRPLRGTAIPANTLGISGWHLECSRAADGGETAHGVQPGPMSPIQKGGAALPPLGASQGPWALRIQ